MLSVLGYFLKADNEKASLVVNNKNWVLTIKYWSLKIGPECYPKGTTALTYKGWQHPWNKYIGTCYRGGEKHTVLQKLRWCVRKTDIWRWVWRGWNTISFIDHRIYKRQLGKDARSRSAAPLNVSSHTTDELQLHMFPTENLWSSFLSID